MQLYKGINVLVYLTFSKCLDLVFSTGPTALFHFSNAKLKYTQLLKVLR